MSRTIGKHLYSLSIATLLKPNIRRHCNGNGMFLYIPACCLVKTHTKRQDQRRPTHTVSTRTRALTDVPACVPINDRPLQQLFYYRPSPGLASFSSQASSGTSSTKILFDSECKLCAVEISGLKKFARNKSNVEFVDITSEGYDPNKYNGVTYEDAMKVMTVIGPGGQIYTQGDAVRQMYRACGLGWLARVTELPGVKPMCDRMYTKFAIYRLSKALDKCDQDGGSCSVKLHHLREKLRNSES